VTEVLNGPVKTSISASLDQDHPQELVLVFAGGFDQIDTAGQSSAAVIPSVKIYPVLAGTSAASVELPKQLSPKVIDIQSDG